MLGVQVRDLDAILNDMDVGPRRQLAGHRGLAFVHDDRGGGVPCRARLKGAERGRLAPVNPRQGRRGAAGEVPPFPRIDVDEIEDQGNSIERRREREARHAGTIRQHDVGWPTGNDLA